MINVVDSTIPLCGEVGCAEPSMTKEFEPSSFESDCGARWCDGWSMHLI